MNQAAQIIYFHDQQQYNNRGVRCNAVVESCELSACATDQDWDNETTTFTFPDNSVIVVSGTVTRQFACKA